MPQVPSELCSPSTNLIIVNIIIIQLWTVRMKLSPIKFSSVIDTTIIHSVISVLEWQGASHELYINSPASCEAPILL